MSHQGNINDSEAFAAERENAADGSKPVGIDEVSSSTEVPLSEASRSGFNLRAWNDPPQLLMITKPKTHVATPRPRFNERVAYPVQGSVSSGASPGTPGYRPLDPNGPPPMSGQRVRPPPSSSTSVSSTEFEPSAPPYSPTPGSSPLPRSPPRCPPRCPK